MWSSSHDASLCSAVEETVAVELSTGSPADAVQGKLWKSIMRYAFLNLLNIALYSFLPRSVIWLQSPEDSQVDECGTVSKLQSLTLKSHQLCPESMFLSWAVLCTLHLNMTLTWNKGQTSLHSSYNCSWHWQQLYLCPNFGGFMPITKVCRLSCLVCKMEATYCMREALPWIFLRVINIMQVIFIL